LWQAVVPPGLLIDAAQVLGLYSQYVNDGTSGDWGGDFYWDGGASSIVPSETSPVFTGLSSTDFGWQLVCGKSTCSSGDLGEIQVTGVILSARETAGPTLSSPSGLWDASGWIRGDWTLGFSGGSPSGICSLSASLGGQALAGSSATPDISAWHQCDAAPVSDPVATSAYPQGADTLTIGGTDAAHVPVSDTRTVQIDNQAPTVALSGPATASSTAGTQYVTAAATAGPSGVAGISFSVDGAPAQWYAPATARIPVSGLGEHNVSCTSQNNAVNAGGQRAVSAPASFSLDIGQPTVASVTFSNLVDRLRCTHRIERIRIPGRWVTVRVHGQKVRVHEGAHSQRVRVTHCHARILRRRITVWATVRRHGKKVRVRRHRTVRVVLVPHTVLVSQQRVAFGHAAVVQGWLGTAAGVALAGQPVQVLTAPANGSTAFTPSATAVTAANGGWSATLPPGPSRQIEVSYAGTATTLPATSAPVTLRVPARIRLLSITPRRVAWGGTIRLVGQLEGGDLPPGGALVRLRIGRGHAVSTYGVHQGVSGDGRFTTSYTFGAGDPALHLRYWFQIATLSMGAYPYAPANSRRLSVTVGGHPRPHHHRPDRRRRHR
ncbi:MAG: hypothetical protein ACRDLV_05365, partial [Solirubrobacteraceae bacterium]